MADEAEVKRARIERIRLAKEQRDLKARQLQRDTIDAKEREEKQAFEAKLATFIPVKAGAVPLSKDYKSIKFSSLASGAKLSTAKVKRSSAFGHGQDQADDDAELDAASKRQRKFSLEDSLPTAAASNVAAAMPERDPLEDFMRNVNQEVETIARIDKQNLQILSTEEYDGGAVGRQNFGQDVDEDEEEDAQTRIEDMSEEDILAMAIQKAKKKDLQVVDHSRVEYEPFRKDFYVEAPTIAQMNDGEVADLRAVDNIRVRGQNCPKPIVRWTQCGLPLQCERVIKQLAFDAPTPIQAQAIPALMSGRDVIGIAKTGSGKTMAFLLPMLRHVKDQRPVSGQDGPIALIMIPTRELAMQIHSECKRFTKIMNLRLACAYGGAPIKDQIAELKRGAEILVCTPGRLIDLLCANNGRVTNLHRVTYLVLDESDRLFDFGFEQQVTRIISNIRPDSQRLLFSATFPKPVEALARRILKKPLEITVGNRSVVCNDVKQFVEVLDADQKFLRLLDILGNWYKEDSRQRMLIFVDRQDSADELLRELFRRGYRCLSLHGGKDQMDRDSTIYDFKSGACSILVATSVAARGLDVPELNVVINFDCPNHKEDYVHRVGRTGRAGRKGTSYTFVSHEEEKFAPGILQALTESNAAVPPSFKKMVDDFMEKVNNGEEQLPGSGFGGKGLDRIEKDRENMRKAQKRSYAGADADDLSEDEAEPAVTTAAVEEMLDQATVAKPAAAPASNLNVTTLTALSIAQERAARVNLAAGMTGTKNDVNDVLDHINAQFKDSAYAAQIGESSSFSAEIEINDFPQKARWKVNSGEFKNVIAEMTKCSVTTRGTHFPAGKQPKGDERKLFVIIEGLSKIDVEKAKAEVKRALAEATAESLESGALPSGSSRYSVL